ncbi:ATP-binding cassette domain-containing protein [[Pseudopropionibacterium] massiliense]|uniref:ATP-binding cassette domain-containing protein n=1 Tax=[Pseudopropionibacterium] massiliense TaxID=2220000 RepID=UPI0010312A97|nr:ABC transporter ATP-binding protein [[Pseudopropionibacterium] massiliense]
MNDDSPLRLRGITKEYKEFRLGPIDLDVPRGYVMGLVGANGAGKTTAIKIALGAVLPGNGVAHMIDKTRVGVVLDRPCWPSRWRVRDISRLLGPFYPGWNQQVFDELCEWAGASRRLRVKEFSRGMGMKMQMAFALAHEAELLVLDEPTSGLDPLARGELLDKLSEFMTSERHSVLFSTHITTDLDRIADLVTILDAGRVIASGSRDDLLEAWVMVRGGVADLTDDLSSRVRGLRRHSVGWEGLLPVTDLGLCGPGVVAETPSIEELLVHLTKEGKNA